MGTLITGLVSLAAALWLVWHLGLPLAGSLWRARGRKAKSPTPHVPPNLKGPFRHGAPDRKVSELEMVPGTGDPVFDEIAALLAEDGRLTKMARRARW